MFKRFFHGFVLLAFLAGLLAVTPATPAYALTLPVTNTNNSGAGSLRQALLDAVDGDVIDLTGVSGTITLASALTITDDVTINGPGAANLTISGNNVVRVFTINTGKAVTINQVTISNGKVVDANGAGIDNLGSLTLDHVVVSNNTIVTSSFDLARGGGIYSADGTSLTVTNSTVSGNTAIQQGGGIYVGSNANVHLENVIIDNNQLTSVNGIGGGISIREGTTAFLDKLTITNNFAIYGGGGMYVIESLTITNSLIANNSAASSQVSGGYGGGMVVYGSGKTLTLTNVTFNGNSADNASNNNANGGGIMLWAGTLNLNNVTLAGNTAEGAGGGIFAELGGGAAVNLRNTIISGNTSSALPNDCYGDLNSLGYNLIQEASCTIGGTTTGNLTGVDPLLGALANNSGTTQTMALGAGSPAINSGTNTGCPATDQRGITRPQGGACDMGAFEAEIVSLTLNSQGANDGWILESTEASGSGGSMNKNSTQLYLGDDAANRQYRSLLSFDTSSLPDNAVITKVTLKFKYAGLAGTSPFGTHGNLLVDIRKGGFGGNPALQLGDFKAAHSKLKVLAYNQNKPANWYSRSFNPADFNMLNKLGVTQFRLRFAKDDNNDLGADFLKIFSGNAGAANRPQLIVEYFVP